MSPQAFAEIGQLAAHLLQLLRDDPRVMQEHSSCCGELNPPALPFQERSAKRIFHGADTLTRRRQCHVRASGPVRDAASFGDVHEQSQVGQIEPYGHREGRAFIEQLRDEGKNIYDSILGSSVARLRPILMTSIATAIGALPLAIATGAGAGARNSVGTAVAGGMVVSTILSIIFIPVLYVIIRSVAPGRVRGHATEADTAVAAPGDAHA